LGKQAENAARYLAKGSHVNVVGRVQNNSYTHAKGAKVYGFMFTCEEIDYLDSRAESQSPRGLDDPGRYPTTWLGSPVSVDRQDAIKEVWRAELLARLALLDQVSKSRRAGRHSSGKGIGTQKTSRSDPSYSWRLASTT